MKAKLLAVLLVILLVAVSRPAGATLLSTASETVRTIVEQGEVPLVVMDLDETLILSHARKSLAYKEALTNLSGSALAQEFPEALQKAQQLTMGTFFGLVNAYDPGELFGSLGIHDREFVKRVSSEMVPRYLSGRYLDYDSEVPCAASFVRQLTRLGAYPVFVSSRYESTQGQGTRASLLRLRFIDKDTPHLTLLRADGMSSIDFKKAAFRAIHETETVAGKPARPAIMIENEPENLTAMGNQFPAARLYFVEGAFLLDGPVPPAAVRIRDFCD